LLTKKQNIFVSSWEADKSGKSNHAMHDDSSDK